MLIALPNAFGDAAQNMAIDAALLSSIPAHTALFRHYGWTEPAATFGYTQKWKAVKALLPDDLRLCRRITGGGIVDHRNDWTYSIHLPRSLPVGDTPPTQLYLELHLSILETLQQAGVPGGLAPCPRTCDAASAPPESAASQCFIEASANDVLRPDGAKIAGAALKRTRDALLIQGSILREHLPDAFDYANFQRNFLARLSRTWELPITEPGDLRPIFQSEHIAREQARFKDPEWLKKR
jgi:lipoate-protein ligase A